MTHPGPALTDYVDGTLPHVEHARIEAHLLSCATCRQEVALASAGRAAAGALATPATPGGIADAAVAEAMRDAKARAPEVSQHHGSSSQRPRPATPRWLAIAGAAAVAALIAFVVPKLGQPGSSSSPEFAAASAGASDVAHPVATAVEIQNVDYGSDVVDRVAVTLGRTDVGSAQTAVPVADSGPGVLPEAIPGPEAAVRLSPDRLRAATGCLAKAYPVQDGTPTRVILARYEGQPAYLGVYLQGPGGGLPPDSVLLVVAAVQGCQPLQTGTFHLP